MACTGLGDFPVSGPEAIASGRGPVMTRRGVRPISEPTSDQPPDFLIVGAMKSGTTSLHHWVGSHPDVSVPMRKEVAFFAESGVSQASLSKGKNWYLAQFPNGNRLRGETSTAYTKYPRVGGVPARIHELAPDVRIIYILRDPIQRLISHYRHNVVDGTERRSLAQILHSEMVGHYFACSLYGMQMSQYREFFSREKVKIVCLEDLARRPPVVAAEVIQFLGLDASKIDRERHLVHNSISDRVQRSAVLLDRAQAGLLRAEGAERAASADRRVAPTSALDSIYVDSLPSSLLEDLRVLIREDLECLYEICDVPETVRDYAGRYPSARR